MSKSVKRVERALAAAGLTVETLKMPATTRTAQEAAAACGCDVAQIVKSLIFEGVESGKLVLLLVSGNHQVDMDRAAAVVGEALKRADPKRVREETGFAIGGVAPLGHKSAPPCWMDETLLDFSTVWAAAGAPDTVFEVNPHALRDAIGATTAVLS